MHGREIPKFENLFLSTVERYIEDGLDMRMETTVTDLDLDRGTVTAKNTHEGFDKLVIGTGFTWEKPDVPGANLEGLHYVKDIRAAMLFDEQLEGMKRAVVIGATRSASRWPATSATAAWRSTSSTRAVGAVRVLDPDVAEPVHESLEKRGVTLRLGTKVEGFTAGADGRVERRRHQRRRARVRRRDRLPAQAPQQRLAEAAGVRTGTTGIVVDERMRTSADAVWAAGDVVEVRTACR